MPSARRNDRTDPARNSCRGRYARHRGSAVAGRCLETQTCHCYCDLLRLPARQVEKCGALAATALSTSQPLRLPVWFKSGSLRQAPRGKRTTGSATERSVDTFMFTVKTAQTRRGKNKDYQCRVEGALTAITK